MVKIWSETPAAQAREVAADIATLVWVVFWGALGWQVYSVLAQFAEAGRVIRGGGRNIGRAGEELGSALRDTPLLGEQLDDAARRSLAAAGQPFVQFGTELESLILILAAVLGALVIAVPLLPWLFRYVPWRWERLQRLRAAHRAIRRAPTHLADPQVKRLLASRAVHRLDWEELLEYTPDPLGDWAAGRHDRLVQAELASAGLRLR